MTGGTVNHTMADTMSLCGIARTWQLDGDSEAALDCLEFRLLRLRKADRGDQLALAQRRFEQAFEEVVCRMLAGVGRDRGIERHDRRRIVRRRIVVGH